MDSSRILGLPVKDMYERDVGILVGFEIDSRGMPSRFFITTSIGSFLIVDSEAVETGKDYILLKNFWKIRAEDFIRGVEITRKRIDALERLKQEQQIPANIYEELRKIYMRDMGELDNKIAELSSELNRVREELKNRLSTLVKVRSVNQVHFSTGEIDEISYKAAENIIESSLDITLLEIKEVESILARLKNIKQKIAPESIAQQRVSSFIELLKSMNTVRQQNNDSPLVVHLQSTIQSQ